MNKDFGKIHPKFSLYPFLPQTQFCSIDKYVKNFRICEGRLGCTVMSRCSPFSFSFLLLGLTGNVNLDQNGDRIPIFIIDNVQKGRRVAMQHFDPVLNTTTIQSLKYIFAGGVTTPPRAIPVCGFYGNLCITGMLLST